MFTSESLPEHILLRILEGAYNAWVNFLAYVVGPIWEFVEKVATSCDTSFTLYGHRLVREGDGSITIIPPGERQGPKIVRGNYVQRDHELRELIAETPNPKLTVRTALILCAAGTITSTQLKAAEKSDGVIRGVEISGKLYNLIIVDPSSEINLWSGHRNAKD
jgi:hypothetical protein